MAVNTVELAPFGKISITEVEGYYEAEISLNGKTVEIDLNFEEEIRHAEDLEKVRKFIENIEQLADKSLEHISKDFELPDDDGTAHFYLKHHLDVCSQEEIMDLFGTLKIDKKLFMEQLSVYRIGFYPEEEESFAIFDVQFPRDFTDYLMAVTYDNEGELVGIDLES